MGPATIIESIAAVAADRPGAPAIVLGDRTMTYESLWQSIDTAALRLASRGARPGNPVAMLVANVPLHLVVLLALFRLGAPVLPLSSSDPAALRRSLMTQAGARFVIAGADADVDPDLPLITIEDAAGAAIQARPPALPLADAVAYFDRAPAQPGAPPVLLPVTFTAMRTRQRRIESGFPLGPTDRHLCLVPLSIGAGRFHALQTLAAGAALVVPSDQRTALALAATVLQQRTTMTALTPALVRRLLALGLSATLFPEMRLLLAGSTLSAVERDAAMNRLSPALHLVYGTRETGPLTMASPTDLQVDIETAGPPLPEIEAEAVDDDDLPVPSGTSGRLRFRGRDFPALDPAPMGIRRIHRGWFEPGHRGRIGRDGRVRLDRQA